VPNRQKAAKTLPAQPPYTTFPELIEYLIDKHEQGVGYRMAKKLKCSSATVYMWKSGVIQMPKWPTVQKLCTLYDLDQRRVVMMLTGLEGMSGPAG
jgi:hypothetical protein